MSIKVYMKTIETIDEINDKTISQLTSISILKHNQTISQCLVIPTKLQIMC